MTNLETLQNELNELKITENKIGKEWVESEEYGEEKRDKFYLEQLGIVMKAIREKEKEIKVWENKNVKVGDGITIHLYSDSHAYTIIKRTEKTITIQRDKATLKEGWHPEIISVGFGCYCENQYEQEYDYERDEEGHTITLRWSNKKQCWSAPNGYASVRLGRHEFYDYNF